jgi:hypothetical protein
VSEVSDSESESETETLPVCPSCSSRRRQSTVTQVTQVTQAQHSDSAWALRLPVSNSHTIRSFFAQPEAFASAIWEKMRLRLIQVLVAANKNCARTSNSKYYMDHRNAEMEKKHDTTSATTAFALVRVLAVLSLSLSLPEFLLNWTRPQSTHQ